MVMYVHCAYHTLCCAELRLCQFVDRFNSIVKHSRTSRIWTEHRLLTAPAAAAVVVAAAVHLAFLTAKTKRSKQIIDTCTAPHLAILSAAIEAVGGAERVQRQLVSPAAAAAAAAAANILVHQLG
jgi:hypothetical protein